MWPLRGQSLRRALQVKPGVSQAEMRRLGTDATEEDILSFARAWVQLAADQGFEAAVAVLDANEQIEWSQSLLDEMTFNHFDDGAQPRITDPRAVPTLRVDAYPYQDGSGFAVDHDLPMDGKQSDFTAQFEFHKTPTGYRIILMDVHVL